MIWQKSKASSPKGEKPKKSFDQQKLIWNDAEKIETKIKKMITEELDVDISRVQLEAEFYKDLGASLDFVELIMRCEEEFSIDIPDADADQYATVGGLIHYIQASLGIYEENV